MNDSHIKQKGEGSAWIDDILGSLRQQVRPRFQKCEANPPPHSTRRTAKHEAHCCKVIEKVRLVARSFQQRATKITTR